MSIPTEDAPWATDANYPAGAEPEAGTPTKVALALDQDTLGNRPDAIPTAQEDNDWRNRVGLWTTYIKSLAQPKWKWLPMGAAQHANSPTPYGTFLPQGFYGEAAQVAYASISVDLPVGARLLKAGIRYRHAAGEPNGGVVGSLWLNRLNSPANGVNAANTPIYIASNPAQAVNPTVNLIEIIGNNGAGALWETTTVDIAQTSDYPLLDDNKISFVLVGGISGTGQIESVGYQFQLES